MFCTNLYMLVYMYTEATYKSQTFSSWINAVETTHSVFSVTKQNVKHTALEWTVLPTNPLCVRFELISTENWPNHLSADMIIEKEQSFPPGSVEHKYWWFQNSTMSYLLPFYISLDVSYNYDCHHFDFLCQCWFFVLNFSRLS